MRNYKLTDIVPPPSEFLNKAISSEIRNHAAEAEQLKTLHKQQLSMIHQQRWFNMYVPKAYGGLELSLPEILRIEEGLSWADGSAGWVVTLCSGAAWFIGFLDSDLVKEVFANDNVCIAGSGAVTGTARKMSTGYEITGYWKNATGSLHATAFTANCHVHEQNKPLFNTDGTPVVYSFLLKPTEVIVHRTWNGMGMIATGSHAIEVKQVHVPLNRAFIIDPAHAKLKHPIFQYPFLQLAETTLAINLSGMASRFLDLCGEIFLERAKSHDHSVEQIGKLAGSQADLNSYRRAFYKQSDLAWEKLVSKKNIPNSDLEQVSQVSLRLAHRSRELVNELYPHCGLAAADTRNEINRVWRNIHTAGQHSLFYRKSLAVDT